MSLQIIKSATVTMTGGAYAVVVLFTVTIFLLQNGNIINVVNYLAMYIRTCYMHACIHTYILTGKSWYNHSFTWNCIRKSIII